MSREEEIRARLEAAAPAVGSRVLFQITPLVNGPGGLEIQRAGVDLAAHAPGDIDWLLGEVERLRAVVAAMATQVYEWHVYQTRECGEVYLADAVQELVSDAAYDARCRTLAGGDQ